MRWALLALLALILSAGFVPFPLGATGESPQKDPREAKAALEVRKESFLSLEEQDRLEGRRAALEFFLSRGDWKSLSSFVRLLLAKETLPLEKALGREWMKILEKHEASAAQPDAEVSDSEGESGSFPTNKRKKVRKAAPATRQKGQSLGLKKATGR